MANTWVVSDTHFGHSRILEFKDPCGAPVRPFDTVEIMDQTMIATWNSRVAPEDRVYHLGDVAMRRQSVDLLGQLNGDKVLIRGNHDIYDLELYLKYFRDVRGVHVTKEGIVLSHIPLHPGSMDRWPLNIHGHLHGSRVRKADGTLDPRYICASVEHWAWGPVLWDEIVNSVPLTFY